MKEDPIISVSREQLCKWANRLREIKSVKIHFHEDLETMRAAAEQERNRIVDEIDRQITEIALSGLS